jgi:lipopolysaccharide biosynthesis glycosyltransferase
MHLLSIPFLILAAYGLRGQPPSRAKAHSPTRPVDVVVLSDQNYIPGVAAIINASRIYTAAPVRFWVGFDGEPSLLYEYLECVGVESSGVTVRRPYNTIDRAARAGATKERLKASANFARFALPQVFPELNVAWYFDADVLPLGDLERPLREFQASGAAIRPCIRQGTIASQFPSAQAIQTAYASKYPGREFRLSAPSWNAGVWLADFAQWAQHDIAGEASDWVAIKAAYKSRTPLWTFATQPLMYLIFHEATKTSSKGGFLPTSWNCETWNSGAGVCVCATGERAISLASRSTRHSVPASLAACPL